MNLKNVRVLARPMLFDIELRRQCQPLIFPPVQASNGAPPFVKRYPSNVILVYGLGDAEWRKYSNSFTGFKHNKDYLDRCTVSTNKMGVNVSFLLIDCRYEHALVREVCRFAVRRVFATLLYWKQYSCCRRTNFTKNRGKNRKSGKKSYRIIVWPARPLNG